MEGITVGIIEEILLEEIGKEEDLKAGTIVEIAKDQDQDTDTSMITKKRML